MNRLERLALRLIRFWPPFLGAGIRVRRLPEGGYEARMPLLPWNRNWVGTHYGGSLYSMCDPFFMLLLLEALGGDYVVWDKSAQIRFRRPGRGVVRARFLVPPAAVAAVRDEVARTGRAEPVFITEVRDAGGEVVAEVQKVLSVRRREATPAARA